MPARCPLSSVFSSVRIAPAATPWTHAAPNPRSPPIHPVPFILHYPSLSGLEEGQPPVVSVTFWRRSRDLVQQLPGGTRCVLATISVRFRKGGPFRHTMEVSYDFNLSERSARFFSTIKFARHIIASWTELFGIEIVYVLAAIDTEGRTAIGGTHVIAFVEWRLWARQSGDWRSRGRALS